MFILFLCPLLATLRASAVLLDDPSGLKTNTYDYIVIGGIISFRNNYTLVL
jgi:hypothetical protein